MKLHSTVTANARCCAFNRRGCRRLADCELRHERYRGEHRSTKTCLSDTSVHAARFSSAVIGLRCVTAAGVLRVYYPQAVLRGSTAPPFPPLNTSFRCDLLSAAAQYPRGMGGGRTAALSPSRGHARALSRSPISMRVRSVPCRAVRCGSRIGTTRTKYRAALPAPLPQVTAELQR